MTHEDDTDCGMPVIAIMVWVFLGMLAGAVLALVLS